MPETKLQRAGRLTIRKLMMMMVGDSKTWLDDRCYCGFCSLYYRPKALCSNCPLLLAEDRKCHTTKWYNAIRDKEIAREDIIPDCQALILWISALTGAPIPKDLEE